jgi:flagellar motor switch protein FliN/FliY
MAKTAQAVEEKTQETKNPQSEGPYEDDSSQQDSKKQAQTVEFSEADTRVAAAGSGASFDILLDMNVPVTVVIGQTQMSVRQLLQSGPGSVLKLDKPIDDPADLYLKDTKFAEGTVVVVDGRFAVKIKQILGLGGSTANPTETQKRDS